jgi:hypothetical protein
VLSTKRAASARATGTTRNSRSEQEYEHSGGGRLWRSWADAAEWVEERGGHTDYVESYPEETGGDRWTSTTGKGKGQAVRGQSRPPVVRVASPPKEEDVHYYRQDPPTGRGVTQYVPPSGKGSGKPKASDWDFPEPERRLLAEVRHKRVLRVVSFHSVRCLLALFRVHSLRGRRVGTWI